MTFNEIIEFKDKYYYVDIEKKSILKFDRIKIMKLGNWVVFNEVGFDECMLYTEEALNLLVIASLSTIRFVLSETPIRLTLPYYTNNGLSFLSDLKTYYTSLDGSSFPLGNTNFSQIRLTYYNNKYFWEKWDNTREYKSRIKSISLDITFLKPVIMDEPYYKLCHKDDICTTDGIKKHMSNPTIYECEIYWDELYDKETHNLYKYIGDEDYMIKFDSAYSVTFNGEKDRRENAHILTPKIEKIYANKEKGTIVIKWQTGETTKVTCHKTDKWDLEKGIMAAITKYVLGNNYNSYTTLEKYIKSVKVENKNKKVDKNVDKE